MAEVTNPTKMSSETVKKLEEAFAIDASIEEACFYAGISKQTYFNWVDSFPDMKENFDRLRNKPVLKARQEVVKGLTNYQNAMDYLSRKRKAEFSQRQENTGADGAPLTVQVINYGNTTPPIPTEKIPDEFSPSVGQPSEASVDSVASKEWEGFDSNIEPTQENAGA